MNKKGRLVLRDIVFMMMIFAGVISFASILVNQMGTEYDNANMTSSYNQDEIGSTSLKNSSDTWAKIGEDLSGDNGIIKMLGGGLAAIGQILKEVLLAPATFASMITSTLEIVGVETELQNVIGLFLTGILYALIIFGIVKVFLRGGEI